MAIRKNFTKDELKAFITILKDITGVEYNTRNLPSKDACMNAMIDILDEFAYQKYMNAYGIMTAENMFLKTQIEQLKNKKWWKFWR